MIEYIYDCIRANAGQEITVSAKLTNDDGSLITEDCVLNLYDPEGEHFYSTPGTLVEELWIFSVPANITEGRKGRHWYCIGHNGSSLCFREPIYLK